MECFLKDNYPPAPFYGSPSAFAVHFGRRVHCTRSIVNYNLLVFQIIGYRQSQCQYLSLVFMMWMSKKNAKTKESETRKISPIVIEI